MKRFKTGLTTTIGVVLLATVMLSLVGCSSKYRTVNFTADNEHTIGFSQSDSVFTITAPGGIAVGTITPSGVWNTNDKGETKYVGVLKEENFIELKLYLKPEYDPVAVTVLVNGNVAENKGTSPYLKSGADGDELFTAISYRYEGTGSEKSFDVQIGGIKILTIGGHKWKLHGIVKSKVESSVGLNEIYIYGDAYDNLAIGSGINYTFDFKADKTTIATAKYGDSSMNAEGTWSEVNSILTTNFIYNEEEEETITMTIMTEVQRKNYITDIEKRQALSEENKAIGMGVMCKVSEGLYYIFVLDLQHEYHSSY